MKKTKDFKELMNQIKDIGQKEPGLINIDGLLINGNTWSGNGQAILVYNNQHKPVLNVTPNNFTSSTQVVGPSNLNDGIWHHIVALRRSGTLEMYVDGNLVSTQSGSTQNVNNTSRKLMIGHVGDAVGFWKGDLALIRISLSSPSATHSHGERQMGCLWTPMMAT